MNVIRTLGPRQEPQALDDRPQPRPRRTPALERLRRDRRQPEQRVERGRERHGVDPVRELVAARADRHAAEQRPDGEAEVERRHVERVGGGQQLAASSRGMIAPRVGLLTAKKRRLQGHDGVQHGHRVDAASTACTTSTERTGPQARRRDQCELAAVDRVRERAAVQARRRPAGPRRTTRPGRPRKSSASARRPGSLSSPRSSAGRAARPSFRARAAGSRRRPGGAGCPSRPCPARDARGHCKPLVWPIGPTYGERTREGRWS